MRGINPTKLLGVCRARRGAQKVLLETAPFLGTDADAERHPGGTGDRIEAGEGLIEQPAARVVSADQTPRKRVMIGEWDSRAHPAGVTSGASIEKGRRVGNGTRPRIAVPRRVVCRGGLWLRGG